MPLSPTEERVIASALALDAKSRQRVAEVLWASVDDPTPDTKLSPEWIAEIERRMDEIDNGTAKLIPADEVMREARERLRR